MSSRNSVRIAGDKHRANQILRGAGLPVPESHLFDASEATTRDLSDSATKIGYPVVLKPIEGSKGDGVYTNITGEEELISYYEHLTQKLHYRKIVMESQAQGNADVRVLVIGEQVAGATHRIPANVVGDGRHTISELIDQKNATRSENPFLHSGPIIRDNEVLNYTRDAGYTMESILPAGLHLRLRGKSNGSAGGDSVDVTDELPKEIGQACVRAVHAIPGLFCGGVDVLYDKTSTHPEASFRIIEINATPQIGLNMYPIVGEGRDVPKIWLDVCFPGSSRSGIVDEETLTFSIDEVLAALRSGAASEVTFAPIPPNRLPHRRRYHFDSKVALEESVRQRLVSRARRRGISGYAQRSDDKWVLCIAGETSTECDTFAHRFSKILEVEEPPFSVWPGVVRLGFRFAKDTSPT